MAFPLPSKRRLLAAFAVAAAFSGNALAAGSVEMQVEHLVKQAMAEYNTAMEEGDSASFAKYFASNATFETPTGRFSGRKEIAKYFEAEFKTFKATYEVKKMLVQGSSAAIVITWDGTTRSGGDSLKVDLVGVYEVGSSGQFSSARYYYDSARAKALADLGK